MLLIQVSFSIYCVNMDLEKFVNINLKGTTLFGFAECAKKTKHVCFAMNAFKIRITMVTKFIFIILVQVDVVTVEMEMHGQNVVSVLHMEKTSKIR